MRIRSFLSGFGVLLAAAAIVSSQGLQIGRGNITTAVGTGDKDANGNGFYNGDGKPGPQTQLNFYIGGDELEDFAHLAFDPAGNLYFPDKGNQLIRKLDKNGIVTTIAGSPGVDKFNGDQADARKATLSFPTGIFVDQAGNIFFTDEDAGVDGGGLVRKIDTTGALTTVAGSGKIDYDGDNKPATQAALNGPTAVVVDTDGTIYFTDQFHDRVRKVDPKSGLITTVAGNGQHGNSLAGPDSVVGTSITLGWPSGLALDGKGNLFIADQTNNAIRVLNLQTGLIRRIAGTGQHSDDNPGGNGGPATQAALGYPIGLVLDPATGDLYFADMHNNAIRKITTPLTANAIITTIAGTGFFGFAGDGGPASAAQLARPTGLTLDANGNLYFMDWYNQRIRKVTPGSGIPQPLVFTGGVVSAGGFAPAPAPVAPGSIVAIFGRNLAPGIGFAAATPLPTSLFDSQPVSVRVTAGGGMVSMPLFFVSPDQINAQLPFEVAPGQATLTVDVGGVRSAPVTFSVSSTATGIFTYPGTNRAVVVNQDGSLNSFAQPAARGSIITVYLTGPGDLDPPFPTGQGAPFAPLSQTKSSHSAIIGGKLSQINYLGATPGYVGLCQANIVVPDNAPVGDQQVVLHVGDQDSGNRPVLTIK